jgi:hypothetical protein
MQTIKSARLVPNLTATGFGLTRCPEELLTALRQGIQDGLATARSEGDIDCILAPEAPLFIDRPDLMERVLHDLNHYPEEWAGMELTPFIAYGKFVDTLLYHPTCTLTSCQAFVSIRTTVS